MATQDLLESFKESLKDVITIVEKLAPHCEDVPSLLAMVKLAIENDIHLGLVMSVVAKKK